jgi:hypothetical protein
MSKLLTALILAAGLATFVYAKVGRRIGYSNPSGVWQLVGITFVLSFIIVFVLFSTLVSLD